MKRIVFVIVGLYVVIGAILIFVVDEKMNEINYFTVSLDYSRLMTSDETLSISLFIDNNKNFLVEENNITGVFLRNADMEVSVDLVSFSEVDSNLLYNDNLYYQYIFEIGFTDVNLEGLNLVIRDCYLDVSYNNGELISVLIGDLFLDFKEIVVGNYLDYLSLSSVTTIIEEEEYLAGVMIKFDNLTNSDIAITDISTNNVKIGFNLVDYYFDVDKPLGKIDEIIPNYINLTEVKEPITINEDGYYVFPIIYREAYEKIFRFPIEIEYSYNGELHRIVIDDYLFLNEMVNFDEYVGHINTYIYQYQESN